MAETTPNTGSRVTVSVYVEDAKLPGDFSRMKNWKWEPTYYEYEDEYLGDSEVVPGQEPKGSTGSFSIEETDSALLGQISQAMRVTERTNKRPKVVIVERTKSGVGTIGKVTFRNVVIKQSVGVGGKGERKLRDFSFRGGIPEEE